ncbi:GH92 family glycosyl hydrolase, partial [Paenibacillus sabuli]|uniref:GH92 family glycosyl hydrolase n=1 Tax=Paenibacillus sabuli TaxID=2772509 RepID=UPI001CC2BBC4
MKKIAITLLAALLLLSGLGGAIALPAGTPAAQAAPIEIAEGWNVALGAEVSASGQCNAAEAARFAVDGRTDTKWCDGSDAANKWLMLDLGEDYAINRWVLSNACMGESGSCPFWNTQDAQLQTSADGETWTNVDYITDNVQSVVDRYVPVFTTRYVRLLVTQGAAAQHTARIFELELYGTTPDQTPAYPPTDLAPVDYVDPLVNTMGDNGQMSPAATVPFGLVSLGPDSDGGAFSGYYYQDNNLKGFSHTRFNGVGCSGAGGNVLMKPSTGDFARTSSLYKERYDRASQDASPGYYTVELASGIAVELTASERVGFHRYTFPEGEADGSVLVDLANAYAGMVDASLTVESDTELSGMVQSRTVCGNGYYTLYYSIQFDQPFTSYASWAGSDVGEVASRTGTNIGVWLDFDTAADREVQAKVGLSAISAEQAAYEREHEIAGWEFDAAHEEARATWSELLNKVEIGGGEEELKEIFYTKLYQAFLHPNNVTSSTGQFRGGQDETTIREASELGEGVDYYNGWSTWDDFRKYPLYSLLEPEKYEHMARSLLDLYETRGSYTQWASGYWPSASVRNEFGGTILLDAIGKGMELSEAELYTALQGMAEDTDHYATEEGQISGKLEKAYSAYYPMKLAAMLGDASAYAKYRDMTQSYQSLWNPEQADDEGNVRGFFTPNGRDVSRVSNVNEYAYQGNLWTYRWFVPHDIQGLAELRGGEQELAEDLLYFFDEAQEYVAVNEPDLHVPYLFNYLGLPYLTQYYAREYTTEEVVQRYHNHGLYAHPIKSRVYRADPEGYLPSMDDDAGAMSSWFVYSAMGLFPGNPGDPYYLIGSPVFPELTLHLDNGETFTIRAEGVSADNRYIQSATLNGGAFDQAWLGHDTVTAGGVLELQMGDTPNTAWGASPEAAPRQTDYTADIDQLLGRAELIAAESQWRYDDSGQPAEAGWHAGGYDDSAWSVGAAPLGYNRDNTGHGTVVSYGADVSDKHPTTYFRQTFDVADPDGVVALEADLIRDDGAVVYLNGREIIRTNMPQGDIAYDTYANGTVGDERDWNGYAIDPAYLVEGENVLAAEVHQVNATSSDIAFAFRLTAIHELEVPDAPTAPVVDDAANTFGWAALPDYPEASDYQYSTDGGLNWQRAGANPQSVGPRALDAGAVQVRLAGDAAQQRAPGRVLVSDAPYTADTLWTVYELEAATGRDGNLEVTVTGTATGEYDGPAVAVTQLRRDGRVLATGAAEVAAAGESFAFTQWFNTPDASYTVDVYLVDAFNGNVDESLWLAEPLPPRAAPAP